MNRSGELQPYLSRRSFELLSQGSSWSLATASHVLVIGLLVWALRNAFDWKILGLWATCLSAVILLQAQLASSAGRIRLPDSDAVERFLRLFTITAYGVGIGWAILGFFLFPAEQPELQLFLVFVMGGMSLAAVGNQHTYLRACYGSMSFAVPLLGARYLIEGIYIQGLLLFLYTLVILRLARMLSQFSQRTLILQFERDQLLEELTARAKELEAARAEADDANLAKSRFLAQASHDLRQPLHAIGLFVETIKDHPVDTKVATVIERVRQSLGILSKLFDSLLDVTLLDTGQIKYRPGQFALMQVFDQIAGDFAPIAEAGDVQLRFVHTSIGVQSDPVLLHRLLQNLVANAVRHAEGGRVVVGVRRRNQSADIWVLDNGRGIAAKDQQRIFSEFVRLAKPGKSTQARLAPPVGLGLGLSIVHRLAKMLNLSIELQSTEGQGSRFSATGLHITDARLQPTATTRPAPDPGGFLDGAQVLIIDDDPDTLEATGALLRKWGCSPIPHTQPPSLDDCDLPDVVLCDYELGHEETGIDVIGRLRSSRDEWLPAIVISGNSSANLKRLTEQAQIPLLHKPVRPAQLRSALLSVLSQNIRAGSDARQ